MIIHYAIITALTRIARDIPKCRISTLRLDHNTREQFLNHLREVFPIYILS